MDEIVAGAHLHMNASYFLQAPLFFFWVRSFIVCGRARRIFFSIWAEMLDPQTRLEAFLFNKIWFLFILQSLVPFYLPVLEAFLFNKIWFLFI
jgi:hypothetical protein